MGRRRIYPKEVGDKVDYHCIIGGDITSTGHEVKSIGEMCGSKVAWITDKSGCVDIKALTMDWKAMDDNETICDKCASHGSCRAVRNSESSCDWFKDK